MSTSVLFCMHPCLSQQWQWLSMATDRSTIHRYPESANNSLLSCSFCCVDWIDLRLRVCLTCTVRRALCVLLWCNCEANRVVSCASLSATACAQPVDPCRKNLHSCSQTTDNLIRLFSCYSLSLLRVHVEQLPNRVITRLGNPSILSHEYQISSNSCRK